VGEEGRELPWARPAGLLNHGLSEDDFGIGSKTVEVYPTNSIASEQPNSNNSCCCRSIKDAIL
jgi:hypothetical protein